jgi:hypothetical protein
MSKSQTLSDLIKTGVKLTQAEAQEIHTRIGDISKGIHESGELFEVVEPKEMGQANNVQATNGFTPLSENEENLLNDTGSVIIIENDPENQFDESLNLDEESEGKELTSTVIVESDSYLTQEQLDHSIALAQQIPTFKVTATKGKAPSKPKAEKAVKAKVAKPEKAKV